MNSNMLSLYSSLYALSLHTAENPCETNNCSHICLLSNLEDGFSCACAEGYGIESDGRSCKSMLIIELRLS